MATLQVGPCVSGPRHTTIHTPHCTTQSTLHTGHYTHNTSHYTLHTTYCTLHTALYTLNNTHCTLHTEHCYTAHCTLHIAQLNGFLPPSLPYLPRHWHRTALHYTTLHYTTLHYTTLQYTTLHNTALHYTTQHCNTLHCTALHYTSLHQALHGSGQPCSIWPVLLCTWPPTWLLSADCSAHVSCHRFTAFSRHGPPLPQASIS